jgi:hypothetical protein
VLLTDPPSGVLDVGTLAADVEAGRIQFGDLLRHRGLSVAPDLLHPWARWITPVGEVRRYDTRFFVAALPDGATPADLTSESSTAGWFPVRAALAEGERGERILMPPTLAVLQSVSAYPTVSAVLAAADAQDLTPWPRSFVGMPMGCASSSRMAPWCRCPGGPGDQRTAV